MYTHSELNITFTPLSFLPACTPSHSVLMLLSLSLSPLCSVAIGIGFYGNSEANDGMYQLTSSLLTANYTLASIDLLVSADSLQVKMSRGALCAVWRCVAVGGDGRRAYGPGRRGRKMWSKPQTDWFVCGQEQRFVCHSAADGAGRANTCNMKLEQGEHVNHKSCFEWGDSPRCPTGEPCRVSAENENRPEFSCFITRIQDELLIWIWWDESGRSWIIFKCSFTQKVNLIWIRGVSCLIPLTLTVNNLYFLLTKWLIIKTRDHCSKSFCH